MAPILMPTPSVLGFACARCPSQIPGVASLRREWEGWWWVPFR